MEKFGYITGDLNAKFNIERRQKMFYYEELPDLNIVDDVPLL